MKVILATGNINKKKEIQDLLASKFNIVTMKDEGIFLNIVEDGKTFEENALIKARTLKKYTKEIIMADDSGLEVEALNGRPGVYSARYAGEGASDYDNNKKLLKNLEGISEEKRDAKFVCHIAICLPSGQEVTFRGECLGRIAFNYSGNNGFGYDPIFIVKGLEKTFGELSAKEKNQISHRAKALEKAVHWLNTK